MRDANWWSAYDVQPTHRPCAEHCSQKYTTAQEAGMPRGDEVRDEYRFSDRDDDVDDLGYGGGGGGSASYDDDDEEDGGWMTHKDDSDDLWDSTDDVDDDEEEVAPVVEVEEDDEEGLMP